MPVDERSRLQLYQRLEQVLGAEEATTLMEHLPPGGSGRLATREDLVGLKHELVAEIHRTARTLALSLTTMVAGLNGIVFTALKLS